MKTGALPVGKSPLSSEKKKEGGITLNDYLCLIYKCGTEDLDVEFVFWDRGDQGWRIYIITDIDYGIRGDSPHAAHWLKEPHETYRYICWDQKIPTIEDAKCIAAIWAETTARYIKNPLYCFNEIADEIKRKVNWNDQY